MPLKGQELHFADQIDGLLERVNRIERYLGGRHKIADGVPVCAAVYSVYANAIASCDTCGRPISLHKTAPDVARN